MFYDNESAIVVDHVSKVYKIIDSPGQRFLYHVMKKDAGRDFCALNDVSFEVKKGESFGIIGRNGSGKSTMLQLLAGILKPSLGNIKVNGRVAALLELGSGFDPESTGYENIYMNAAILGLAKEEIELRIEDIVSFADIGEFINQPVKTYSSGMFVRLAFSVAINVEADVLLIDEALAVGDVFFRQKCYAKLNELKKAGKTIVLVSHAMNEVEQFCDNAVLLNKGAVLKKGSARNVVKQYYIVDALSTQASISHVEDQLKASEDVSLDKECRSSFGGWCIKKRSFFDITEKEQIGADKCRIVQVGLFDENGEPRRTFYQGETAYIYFEAVMEKNALMPLVGFVFCNSRNTIVHGKDSLQVYGDCPAVMRRGENFSAIYRVKLDLGIDEYTFDVGTAFIDKKYYTKRSELTQEDVNEYMEKDATIVAAGSFAIHARLVGQPMKMSFHGIADLQGNIEICVE